MNMAEIHDLEDTIRQIGSEEKQIKFVELLAGKIELPSRYIDQAILWYERKSGECEEQKNRHGAVCYLNVAAEIAQKCNRAQQAQELYRQMYDKREEITSDTYYRQVRERGDLAKKAGYLDDAREYYRESIQREIKDMRKIKGFELHLEQTEKLLEFATQEGIPELMGEIEQYKQQCQEEVLQEYIGRSNCDWERAALLAEKFHKEGMAANYRVLAHASVEEREAIFARQQGEIDKSERLFLRAIVEYENHNKFSDAAKLAERIGKNSWARELYERGGKLDEAARLAELDHNPEEIKRLYDKAVNQYNKDKNKENPEMVARICKRLGNVADAEEWYTKAIEKYEKISNCDCCIPHIKKASKIAEECGRRKKAQSLITIYELLKQHYSVDREIED